MTLAELKNCIERGPIIAAVEKQNWQEVLNSPVEIIFHMKTFLPTVKKCIDEAHAVGKKIFVHIDLAEGIGKDRSGIEYLNTCGVDGIISTRGQLIRFAKEMGLLTVQRFFVFDTHGFDNRGELLGTSRPDLIEIMPGVIGKVISRIAATGDIPVIAGGLVETKSEVMTALSSGAVAVSTGKIDLWYM